MHSKTQLHSYYIHVHVSTHKGTYMAKFARFCMVLAVSVRLRLGRVAGISRHNRKRLGDRMAGHRKRRKTNELMSTSLSDDVDDDDDGDGGDVSVDVCACVRCRKSCSTARISLEDQPRVLRTMPK